MKSATLNLIRGQLRAIKKTDPARLAPLGISIESLAVLAQEDAWTPDQAEMSRHTLDKLAGAAAQFAHLPRVVLTAEMLAAVINDKVSPVNWQSAAYMCSNALDGAQLLLPNGDEMSSRETLSPERLYALVMVAEAEADYVLRDLDAAATGA